MEPITFKNQAAQGDCLITRAECVPEHFVQIDVKENDYAVAHSETGHHHVMSKQHVDFFEAANDPLMLYIVVKEPTVLRHLRSFDTHAPITVDKGIYRINRQREYTPEGWRRAAD
jgi:hypothetical protein